VSVGNASVAEGNAGTATPSFPVSLSHTSTQAVSVSFATANGTAVAPADYTQATGTLTFAPGETAKSIPVGTATGTITNDDTQVPVTTGD
jgi:hypothetical protein